MLADKVLAIVSSRGSWTLESLMRDTGGSASTIRAILSHNGYRKGIYRGAVKPRTKRVHEVSFTVDAESFRKLRATYGNRLQKLCRKLLTEEAQRLDHETLGTKV